MKVIVNDSCESINLPLYDSAPISDVTIRRRQTLSSVELISRGGKSKSLMKTCPQMLYMHTHAPHTRATHTRATHTRARAHTRTRAYANAQACAPEGPRARALARLRILARACVRSHAPRAPTRVT